MTNDPVSTTDLEGSSAPDVQTDLRRERDEAQDRLMRLAAEFDNYRKRTERERRELLEVASAEVIRDLLPVVDDLERALAAVPQRADAAAGDNADAFGALRRGVELIHRQVLEVLRRRGVEPFEVIGRDFDPEWHEAVANDPAGGRRDGEITAEFRRGYRVGPRLLRAAQVKVARA